MKYDDRSLLGVIFVENARDMFQNNCNITFDIDLFVVNVIIICLYGIISFHLIKMYN